MRCGGRRLGEDSESPWVYLVGINKLQNRTVHNLTYFLEPSGMVTAHHLMSVERTAERFNISITYPCAIPRNDLVVRTGEGAETSFLVSYSPDARTTLDIEQYGSMGEIEVIFNLTWHRCGRRGNKFSVGPVVWDDYPIRTQISVFLPPQYVAADWSPKSNSHLTLETDPDRFRISWFNVSQTEINQGGEHWVIFQKPRGPGLVWFILPSLAVILVSVYLALNGVGLI